MVFRELRLEMVSKLDLDYFLLFRNLFGLVSVFRSPALNFITQTFSCIMQKLLKAVKIIFFR